MKSIRYIFLSYFQQDLAGILYTVIAVMVFILAALAAVLGKPDAAVENEFSRWNLHFVPFFIMTYIAAMHLKNMIKNNAAALLPHYRRSQLIATGLILALFIFVPVLIRGIQGIPILAPAAMFLFTAGLILWGIFNFGENVLVIAGILWTGKLAHELLGFKAKVMFFDSLNRFSPGGSDTVFPIFIILLSCTLLFLFARYVMAIPHKETWDSTRHRTNPYTKEYDRVGPLLGRLTGRIMGKRQKGMTGEGKRSRFQLARVFQSALFSPGVTYFPGTVLFLLVVLFYLFSFFYILGGGFEGGMLKQRVVPFLIMIYYISAALLTTDFLQHRHRLPALWLQAQLDSRKTFTGVTILTYLMVAGKQFLGISIYFLLMPVVIPGITYSMVLAMITAGFCIDLVLLSLALLFSDQVVSRECKGWTVSLIVIGVLPIFIFLGSLIKNSLKYLEAYWYFLFIFGLTALFLFWRAYKKWMNTKMDFVDPGEINQY